VAVVEATIAVMALLVVAEEEQEELLVQVLPELLDRDIRVVVALLPRHTIRQLAVAELEARAVIMFPHVAVMAVLD
jgi:hypothetical protein